ncbi:hypothetical protein MBLNU457_5202t1 [Dothideomycetes sp. NU457]
MFRWLSAGTSEEPDASTIIDQPDTPAHLFAARAFKYSLFGTPKPEEQKRTRIQARVTEDQSFTCEPLLSPSKPGGILLTPGTTNLRRTKSVTFGAQVADNQRTRRSKSNKSELPGTVPGKFPSPWTTKIATQKTETTEDTKEAPPEAKSSQTSEKSTKEKDGSKAKEFTKSAQEDARSTEDESWEQKYDDYAQRTQREMKKLIAKQKAAKSYARDRDAKVMDLADRLKQEQRKVQKLEQQVAQLHAELEQYRTAPRESADRPKEEKLRPIDGYHVEQNKTDIQQRSAKKTNVAPTADLTHERSLLHKSPVNTRPTTRSGDLWADVMLSSPAVKITAHQPASTGRSGVDQARTSPLRARDLNTISGDKSTSTPIPASSRHEATSARAQRSSAHRHQQLYDELDDIPDLPQPSPDQSNHMISPLASRPQSSQKKAELSKRPAAAQSSPFMSSPPHYDRFALPFSLPSPGPRNTGNADLRPKSSSPEKSARKIADENKENEQAPMNKGEGKQQLDDERRAKAAARIAARRQKRAAGVV